MATDTVAGTLPLLVLDTNTVLDWLVFKDPGMVVWATAITEVRVRWLGCAVMREELQRLLMHPRLARWQPDAVRALALFDVQCEIVEAPRANAAQRLVCTDADDQVFIDLAVVLRARWLLTHDRALLKLARRARQHGVLVLRPQDDAP